MKPLKPQTFWIVTLTIAIVFVALFSIWIFTMIRAFSDLSSSSDPSPAPVIEKLNIETYKRLFPED